MAKTQQQTPPIEDSKEVKNKKGKTAKAPKEKNGNVLVGRVKKVIKKSRRKMGEEKFEKELQRTIAFLEELRLKLSDAPGSKPEKADKKTVARSKSGNGQIKPKARPKAKSKGKSKTLATTLTTSAAGETEKTSAGE